MKTLLLTISILLFETAECYSQILIRKDNYEKTKTFIENGYIYQCDVLHQQLVTLYNKENKWTYEDIIYQKTGEIYAPSIYEEKELNPIIDNEEMTRKTLSIVDNAFTKDMTKQLGENELHTTMYLDPNTGKVLEVCFVFTTFSPYAQIPLSVYRNIEVQLKEKISYTPTDIGRQLNYIMLSWGQTPKGAFKIITPPGSFLPKDTLTLTTN